MLGGSQLLEHDLYTGLCSLVLLDLGFLQKTPSNSVLALSQWLETRQRYLHLRPPLLPPSGRWMLPPRRMLCSPYFLMMVKVGVKVDMEVMAMVVVKVVGDVGGESDRIQQMKVAFVLGDGTDGGGTTIHGIAFQPKFLPSRVEKERQAILSELQMMNTIEYRVDCQLLQHLHSENKLGCRFPIGLEEQIKKWDIEAIKRFYERWYFPANATLYIVGDIGDVSETVYHIDAVFGLIPPALFPKASESVDHFPAPKLSTVYTGGMVGKGSSPSVEQTKQLVKERQARRPPVKHNWSLPVHGQEPRIPHIFQHELLQNFSIHLFCKVTVIVC
eukprot:Gb_39236 [translate_table: standard]